MQEEFPPNDSIWQRIVELFIQFAPDTPWEPIPELTLWRTGFADSSLELEGPPIDGSRKDLSTLITAEAVAYSNIRAIDLKIHAPSQIRNTAIRITTPATVTAELLPALADSMTAARNRYLTNSAARC